MVGLDIGIRGRKDAGTEPVTKKIELTEEAVKRYLDECIDYWRAAKEHGVKWAVYYLDAYQSVRTSLFGQTKRE